MATQEDYKNIQDAVDFTLNVKSIVRRRKKNQIDKKREMFVQMVLKLEEMAVKSMLAYTDLQIDLSKYEERFYEVIDAMMFFAFGSEATELVSFYIWDRIGPEGEINPITFDNSNFIYLKSPYELWDTLILINPKIVS